MNCDGQLSNHVRSIAVARTGALTVELELPAGDYLLADASLKIKVNLSLPLMRVTESADRSIPQPTTQVCG